MAKTMTPRQIVAANLRELRQERKFSQEKAGQKAAQSLGVTWLEPKTAFSALERSANPDNKRARALTVDELVGLARAFDVSPLRLLLPPDDVTEVRIQQDKPETAI